MKPGAAMLLAALLAAAPARAYCPSYTPAQTATGARCAVEPAAGKNPDVAAWQTIFAKAAGGKAGWGPDGPEVGLLSAGCGRPTPKVDVPARFPCAVLQALVMQESGWRQFCKPDLPDASVGAPERTLVTFDCGYGAGQVTSGMHVGEAPPFDRARVAGDPVYNLATGTRLLRDKWMAVACVGDRQPDVIEHWYSALWAYNGLSYANNPNNPNLKAGRGPWDPRNGGAYAYQERVLGWMEHPPTAAHWPLVRPAYPNRGEIGAAREPLAVSEPACASPTDCRARRSAHLARGCGEASPAMPDGGSGSPVTPTSPGAPPSLALDAGVEVGAAAQGEASVEGSGSCGCRVASSGGSASAVLALGLAVTARRRRRAP